MQYEAVAHEHRALDDVLQLAHVARPVVGREHVDGRRRDAADVLAMLGREALEEMIGKKQHVRLPLTKRRDEDREHVQPVEEVLAERAVRDRLFHVLVRRGNEPDVHFDGLGAAQALELALLEHAEQLHLRRRLDVADLVEENRAVLRELEAARACDPARR